MLNAEKLMKLLVITQAVDNKNTTLGFFTRWLEEFGSRFKEVKVVCLFEGIHSLPNNVIVHSLGKEGGLDTGDMIYEIGKKIRYIIKFYRYIWKYRNEYDVVFVHMNQEYVVLGGLLWKIFGKRIFFWRNHPYGNNWTRIAVFFSDKVFCTAVESFTAQFKKTHVMPAGVDTKIFREDDSIKREQGSLLAFGRIAPVKRVEKTLDLVVTLLSQGLSVELSVVGDALPRDQVYVEELKKRASLGHIEAHTHFLRGVDFVHAPQMYQRHEVYLNFTESGSFDKTVIEALACGTKVLVSNTSMKDLLPRGSYTTNKMDDTVEELKALLVLDLEKEKAYKREAETLVESQSLKVLMDMLKEEMI